MKLPKTLVSKQALSELKLPKMKHKLTKGGQSLDFNWSVVLCGVPLLEKEVEKYNKLKRMPEKNDKQKLIKSEALDEFKERIKKISKSRKNLINNKKRELIYKQEAQRLEEERKMRIQEKEELEGKLQKFVNPNLLARKKKVSAEMKNLRALLKRPNRGGIKISNLSSSVSRKELGDALEEFGKVQLLSIKPDQNNPKKCCAYVYYQKSGVSQQVAEKLSYSILLNKVVKASFIPPESLKPLMFRMKIDFRTPSEEKNKTEN